MPIMSLQTSCKAKQSWLAKIGSSPEISNPKRVENQLLIMSLNDSLILLCTLLCSRIIWNRPQNICSPESDRRILVKYSFSWGCGLNWIDLSQECRKQTNKQTERTSSECGMTAKCGMTSSHTGPVIPQMWDDGARQVWDDNGPESAQG